MKTLLPKTPDTDMFPHAIAEAAVIGDLAVLLDYVEDTTGLSAVVAFLRAAIDNDVPVLDPDDRSSSYWEGSAWSFTYLFLTDDVFVSMAEASTKSYGTVVQLYSTYGDKHDWCSVARKLPWSDGDVCPLAAAALAELLANGAERIEAK